MTANSHQRPFILVWRKLKQYVSLYNLLITLNVLMANTSINKWTIIFLVFTSYSLEASTFGVNDDNILKIKQSNDVSKLQLRITCTSLQTRNKKFNTACCCSFCVGWCCQRNYRFNLLQGQNHRLLQSTAILSCNKNFMHSNIARPCVVVM